MTRTPRIKVTFNEEQVAFYAELANMEIENATDFKEAQRKLHTDLPPDKPAGAPKRKPYQRTKKRKAKGE